MKGVLPCGYILVGDICVNTYHIVSIRNTDSYGGLGTEVRWVGSSSSYAHEVGASKSDILLRIEESQAKHEGRQ